MVSLGLELAGVILSALGWVLSVISCALPMWRVSAFIGANIVTAQVYWEGLWMNCVFQSTGQMQCKVYDSMLALPQDLQAARALTIATIIVGIVALLISMVGAKCTNCIEDDRIKARVMASSGGAFITAALAQLVPVSWSAHTIIIEFYSPLIPSGQKMEIGAALYLGWAAAALLLLGGSILCCSCPPEEEKPIRYSVNPQSRIAYSAAPSMKMGAAAVYIRVSCVSSDSVEQKSDVKGSLSVSDSVSDQQITTFSCFE
ncbi:Claudin-4 Clostridium perfringens enterotoxin receptor [Collichthys lucidus]|uniref:Claudin-4 Clostridium perfringens enterotoxin receptor n=1 Tax=Collichthys lucidus TaxID=240159 RepID=A0A4U5V682_COLLU|nr:Claudin-4 Clostridium perfringens enterotoxin receptor [Collichthys lucidus]